MNMMALGKPSRFLVPVLLVGVLAATPLLIRETYYINLLFLVLLFIALAQSWNILAGLAGQVNLGHAAFFGIGALASRILWISGVNPFLGILAGGVLATFFALIIGLPTFRLRGIYFAIGTLAMAEILRHVTKNALPILSLLPSAYIVEYDLTPRYYLALTLALIASLTVYILVNSKIGLGMMAVQEDEDAAEASGVSALKHKLLALLISSFLAGLTGALFAFYQVSYYYELSFSPTWTFDALIITFVGGVGTIIGPIVGAAFFVVFRELFARFLVEVHLIVFGALFIIVVLLLPGGIIEATGRVRQWARSISSR